ncbi:MAG: hypothetical protein ACE5G0_00150 [Rhodothermales bacterium]
MNNDPSATTATPAVPRPQPRDIFLDAFFDGEWLPDAGSPTQFKMNPNTGCHLNKFEGETHTFSLPNPLEYPSVTIKEVIPQGFEGMMSNYSLFIPAALRQQPPPLIKVSLLFCVRSEMNRHGLRTFFAGKTDRVLITVPGREKQWDGAGKAWGIGITTQAIGDFFDAAGLPNVSWEVRVLAGYSTGYRGLNGTVNNALIDVSKLEKLIFYDALYRGDDPPPGHNTAKLLQAVKSATNNTAQIITYEVTQGGTPRDGGHLRGAVPYKGLINLKPKTKVLIALIFARVLDNGIKDGFFTRSKVPAPILQLIDAPLPKRGTIASKKTATLPAGVTDIDTWAAANSAAINQISYGVRKRALRLIHDQHNLLMGWEVPNVYEMLHDGFIPEFGWEHLAG